MHVLASKTGHWHEEPEDDVMNKLPNFAEQANVKLRVFYRYTPQRVLT